MQIIPRQNHICPGICEKEIREGRCCESDRCDYADPSIRPKEKDGGALVEEKT